jgi:hypothetical protein
MNYKSLKTMKEFIIFSWNIHAVVFPKSNPASWSVFLRGDEFLPKFFDDDFGEFDKNE